MRFWRSTRTADVSSLMRLASPLMAARLRGSNRILMVRRADLPDRDQKRKASEAEPNWCRPPCWPSNSCVCAT